MAAANPAMAEFAQRMAALPDKDRDALMERAEKAADEMAAADARGDSQAALRIGNAAKADMERTVGMPMPVATVPAAASQANVTKLLGAQEKLQADMAKCGTSMPAPPVPPAGYADASKAVRDSGRVAATRASGLEPAQYSVLRERASAWLAVKSGKPANGYVFAPAEVEVLEARDRDLRGRAAALLGEPEAAGDDSEP
ncbi:MAG: hypothetical protein H0X64_12960 [Gemmatimonadaceae bacterium]|nr:hypothetical protein [Gemmatimonadaceae bacterium]